MKASRNRHSSASIGFSASDWSTFPQKTGKDSPSHWPKSVSSESTFDAPSIISFKMRKAKKKARIFLSRLQLYSEQKAPKSSSKSDERSPFKASFSNFASSEGSTLSKNFDISEILSWFAFIQDATNGRKKIEARRFQYSILQISTITLSSGALPLRNPLTCTQDRVLRRDLAVSSEYSLLYAMAFCRNSCLNSPSSRSPEKSKKQSSRVSMFERLFLIKLPFHTQWPNRK